MNKKLLILCMLLSCPLSAGDKQAKFLVEVALKKKYIDFFKAKVISWTTGRDEDKRAAGFDLCELQINPGYKMPKKSEDLLKADNLLDKKGRIPFDMKKFEDFRRKVLQKNEEQCSIEYYV